ncbi:MAG: hypothetical protein EHM85_11990 [Desulfobacteraceae bacterium]|nr:MAG: hypothetical protein EHM85_11990 [Desulfobacteraceae bacterium]
MALSASAARKSDYFSNSMLDYNLCLDDCVAFDLNENFIESKIDELDEIGNSGFIYQLTQARITELALICAGNYADNFEFKAAGDLLVNPRCIRIHIDGVKEPVYKKRHLALTDQFSEVAKTQTGIIRWLGKNTHPEITRKPLIPDLYERLKNAGIISEKYLDTVYKRMNKIAGVIGFLSAYNSSEAPILYQRLQSAKEESAFIKSNLCNFNFDTFFILDHEILKLIENDNYKSVFIGNEKQ